ncbi:MAG TPA: MarR family transcriptional regulator [Flexilinea sp.]|jgi:DNA-binding MarR family transcriptional regulator|nr:MAG: transcriptional regulator SlyA [Chloroflexi bacterium ADurb.Bin344]HNY94483.1 MarR family transcriptional regulator [Flexilinea sp.]HOG21083.1 MarR family transcriptional regulator [Flexilinea sp.]HOP01736.1 MarR family transcriptional regulator [Flexilinea sp.]HOR55170.1 MarR family transcriptional regulator [Flexilinea sp.]
METEKEQIIEKIKILSLQKRNAVFRIAAANGLYPGQLPILEYIIDNEGCTQKEIAKKMRVSPASIASSTKRLQRSGLIQKKVDEGNLRQNMLFVTEKGRELAENCRNELSLFQDAFFDGFSEEELTRLSDILDHINRNISQGAKYHSKSFNH